MGYPSEVIDRIHIVQELWETYGEIHNPSLTSTQLREIELMLDTLVALVTGE